MDMISLIAKMDLSRLDPQWTQASKEETEFMKKMSKKNVRLYRATAILGIITSSLLFVIPLLIYICIEEERDLAMLITSFGFSVVLVVFFVIRGKQLVGRFNRDITVEKKKVFLVEVAKVRYGVRVSYIECKDNHEIINGHLYSGAASMNLKKKHQLGDCLILLKTNNGMMYVNGKNDYGNMLEGKNVEVAPFHKMADHRLMNGDDHRSIDFYMQRTPFSIRFLAVKHRLDVCDDQPVLRFEQYCVEEHSIEGEVNPKLFTEFRHKIIEEVEQEML